MKNYRFLPIAVLAIAVLASCGTVPENSPLNEARNDYTAAQNNPQVTTHAATELKQAADALDKANEAANKNEDVDRVAHLAYLAKQRVAIAQETAKQKEAEAAVANSATERNRIRLEARTQEVEMAKQKAEAAERKAQAAQQQAMMSRQESEAATQEAAMSQEQGREAEIRASQLEAQLKELDGKKTERGLVITLGDVLFDVNKAQLKPGAARKLQKLAAFLKQYPQRHLQIEGHTDSTGSADYNLELSDRRANAVRTALVDMGVDNDRITTHGYGMESPVASNDTAAGRQMNRRVEIILSEDTGNVSLR